MIDFRYHVVSLVSVFIALSLGMVIGGFALRGPVADQLNGQVKALSNDKASLRSQLGAAKDGAARRDDFDAATAPALLAHRLDGRHITVITLPDTDSDLTGEVKKTVTTAGGSVDTTVSLSDKWLDEKPPIDFAKVARDQGLYATSSETRTGGLVLAKALSDPHGALMKSLEDAGLVDVSDAATKGDAFVVMWSDSAIDHSATSRWTDIVAGIGTGGHNVVAASGGHIGENKSDPLMTALRDTPDAVARMSTVDDLKVPMGQVALVWTTRDEIAGKPGQYGTASDATGVLPVPTK